MNKYFEKMRKTGIDYLKRKGQLQTDYSSPFSTEQSLAYKYWAISERIDSSEIMVNDLPDIIDVKAFLNVFEEAGIRTLVIARSDYHWLPRLIECGWIVDGECRVFSKESELYSGKTMIEKGVRIKKSE